MKARRFFVTVILTMALPFITLAQQYFHPDPETDLRARLSVGFDYKLAKGLHLGIDEEARLEENFTKIDRMNTNVEMKYKFNPYFKMGTGYTLMLKKGDIRHRVFLDMTGTVKAGEWNFSLKERLQMTHFSKDINTYQKPKNLLGLKSRLKASYKFRRIGLEPYISEEIRLALNAVKHTDLPEAHYNDVYADRFRTCLGTEWEVNSKNVFDFYVMWDKMNSKVIDATREGRLKSITHNTDNYISIGINYRFCL